MKLTGPRAFKASLAVGILAIALTGELNVLGMSAAVDGVVGDVVGATLGTLTSVALVASTAVGALPFLVVK